MRLISLEIEGKTRSEIRQNTCRWRRHATFQRLARAEANRIFGFDG